MSESVVGYRPQPDGTVRAPDGRRLTWDEVAEEIRAADPLVPGYEAVAEAYEELLRQRHPGTTWEAR